MRICIRVLAPVASCSLILPALVAGQPPPPAPAGQPAAAATRSIDLRRFQAERVTIATPESVRTVAPDRVVHVAPGEYVAARVGANPVRVEARREVYFQLPIQILGVESTGREYNLRPAVEVAGGGLRLRGTTRRFAGSLFVGVEDMDQPTGTRSLETPLELLLTGELDEIDPARVRLEHTNLPFSEVALEAAAPGDAVRLRIRPSFATEVTDLEVPVLRPMLTVNASPPRIQGLGLETAALTVRSVELSEPGGVVVTLRTDRGDLGATNLGLDADGVGTTTIRSSGVGTATIHAEHPLLRAGTIGVAFAWPWSFGAAALVGGVVGGAIRWARRRATGGDARPAFDLVIGVLVGVVVAAAWATGINLLGVTPGARAGEAVVFALSALGSLVPLRPPGTRPAAP